jgi:hypothetical protein
MLKNERDFPRVFLRFCTVPINPDSINICRFKEPLHVEGSKAFEGVPNWSREQKNAATVVPAAAPLIYPAGRYQQLQLRQLHPEEPELGIGFEAIGLNTSEIGKPRSSGRKQNEDRGRDTHLRV